MLSQTKLRKLDPVNIDTFTVIKVNAHWPSCRKVCKWSHYIQCILLRILIVTHFTFHILFCRMFLYGLTPNRLVSISASSKCTTTKKSVFLTSALTTIKELIIKYCNKAYEHDGVNYFGVLKIHQKFQINCMLLINSLIQWTVTIFPHFTPHSLITSSNRNFLI